MKLNFADVVNNTRILTANLSDSITSMEKYADSLVDGEPIPDQKKTILKKYCSDVSIELGILEGGASQIRQMLPARYFDRYSDRYSDRKVAECHRIAWKIGETCGTLSESLGAFEESLDTNIDCQKLYEQVVKGVGDLSQLVISFPRFLKKINYLSL